MRHDLKAPFGLFHASEHFKLKELECSFKAVIFQVLAAAASFIQIIYWVEAIA